MLENYKFRKNHGITSSLGREGFVERMNASHGVNLRLLIPSLVLLRTQLGTWLTQGKVNAAEKKGAWVP